jgi:hypothetical protein
VDLALVDGLPVFECNAGENAMCGGEEDAMIAGRTYIIDSYVCYVRSKL